MKNTEKNKGYLYVFNNGYFSKYFVELLPDRRVKRLKKAGYLELRKLYEYQRRKNK